MKAIALILAMMAFFGYGIVGLAIILFIFWCLQKGKHVDYGG